jgi:hypothetical protein
MTIINYLMIGLGCLIVGWSYYRLVIYWDREQAAREKAERHASCLRDLAELRRYRPEEFDDQNPDR